MKQIILTPFLLFIALVAARAQDPVFTVPGQYGQTFFSYSLNENILFAAPDRFRVTSTVHNDSTRFLFDQEYDRAAITVPAGGSTTLTIDLRGKGGSYIVNPAGYIYLNFVELFNPDSIYIRMYDSTGNYADFNFEDWSNASTTSPYLLWRIRVPTWIAYLSKIEVKVFAHSNKPLVLSEMEYYLEFPGQFEKGLVSKFNNNTMWRDLEWRDTANTKRAYIKSNGEGFISRLGIGTTHLADTNYKLNVEGAIRARKLKVDHDNWPDYVFMRDYKLRPLSAVASFIKTHGHLPDVPSAAQIKENGLDMGEAQAMLMRKVEELTLHMIAQQRLIQAQQRQINRLQRQLQPKRTSK